VALGVAVMAPQRLAKGDHPDRGQVVVPVSPLVA
jgi:hypothetical protein